jgi:type I restriction enzyme M protein
MTWINTPVPAISYNADDLETLHEAVRGYHEYSEFHQNWANSKSGRINSQLSDRAYRDLGARDSKLW